MQGIWTSKSVGLAWFRFMFANPLFKQALKNTLIIALLKIVLGFPVPIVFAILLNEARNKHFKKVTQTFVYLPNFLSWVIVGGIIFTLFNSTGSVNQLFLKLKIAPVQWLARGGTFIGILVGSEIWKGFGFSAVIYLATLSGIDPTLYEAARIDGANKFKQAMRITLPGIMPIVMLIGILNLGNILNAGFEQILILQNPSVMDVSEIIDTLVDNMGIRASSVEFATAVGLFKGVVAAVFIVTANVLAYKFTDYRII